MAATNNAPTLQQLYRGLSNLKFMNFVSKLKLKVILKRLGIFAVLAYLFYGSSLYFFQNSMIFHPRKFEKSASPRTWENIEYQTNFGRQNSFLALTDSHDAHNTEDLKQIKSIWIVFSGNASVSLNWGNFIKEFKQSDVGFFLIDYPGYGYNEGIPSAENIKESYLAALDELKKKFHQVEIKYNFLGYSLGCATALEAASELAKENKIEKIILLAPFTDTLEMAKRTVGTPLRYLYPLDIMLKTRYDNKRQIENLKNQSKIIIFHGENDEVIPFQMGKKLAEISDKIDFVIPAQANHANMLIVAREQIYQFIRE